MILFNPSKVDATIVIEGHLYSIKAGEKSTDIHEKHAEEWLKVHGFLTKFIEKEIKEEAKAKEKKIKEDK